MIRLALEGPPGVGMHGMFTDGLELEAQVIPEPGAIVLLVVAGLGWLGVRRHRDG